MYTHNGNQITPNRPFTLGDKQYPANWLTLASTQDLADANIIYTPEDPLPALKAAKLAALDAERRRLEALPITGNQGGKLFNISRPEKINEFLMGGLSIALDPSPAASFTMLDDNGVEVTYSKVLMGQIISFMNSSKQPALKRYDARKVAIEAAKDKTELDAIDTDLTKP